MRQIHFEVIGWLWSQGLGAYQYTITRDLPKWTRVEARAICDVIRNPAHSLTALPPSVPSMGDFSEIRDVRIIEEVNYHTRARGGIARRVDDFHTLSGWKYGGSRGTYSRLTHGRES